MTSDKFTKDFLDFGSFTRPGMNYPDLYQHSENYGGDGQPGLQWMTQLALSSYGEYHVIDECVPEIDGTDVTGHTGYVMITGNIVEVDTVFKTTLSTNHYLIIESDGGYATTGAKPTGVIIAENINGTIYNISRRESNSINYFPTGAVFYGEVDFYKNIDIVGNITVGGTVDDIDVSGLKVDVDGFPDRLKQLAETEIIELEAIGATTISSTQWGYLGVLDQNLRTTDSPTFANITCGGNVDGIDISTIKLNSMPSAANGNISCNGQAITSVGNVDGVDVSALKSSYDTHAASITLPHISSTSKTQWDSAYNDTSTRLDQAVKTTSEPSFVSINVPTVKCGTDLKFVAQDDLDHYIYMTVAANEPYFRPYADNHGYCGSDTIAWKHVYGWTIHDLSPFPKESVLNKLLKIKSKKDKNELDHRTLPQEFKEENDKTPTRNIGANVSYNTKGIQELYDIIQIQSDLIESLRIRLEALEE